METVDSGTLSGYSPFVEVGTLYVRDFGDGEREVMVRRQDAYQPTAAVMVARSEALARRGSCKRSAIVDPGAWDEAFDTEAWLAWRQARAARDAADAENRERSGRRARQIVCHRIKAIRADRLLTLTYTDNMTDRDRLARDWKAFVRRVRRVQGLEYVATVERQKRGAWHIHVAVRGRQNYRLLRSVWRAVVGPASDGRPGGNIDVRNPFKERPLRHRLAAYMSKYVTKDLELHQPGQRRVWCSEGIKVPERVQEGWRWESWEDACRRMLEHVPEVGEVVGWYGRRRGIFQLVVSGRC